MRSAILTGHKKRPLGCGYTTKGQEAFGPHEDANIITQPFGFCKGVVRCPT